jgi:hypothetical protein
MDEKPLKAREMPHTPGERVIDKPELPPQGLLINQYAECEAEAGGMLKVGRHRHFEILCDEPADLGGHDTHPQPLTYICAGVGF